MSYTANENSLSLFTDHDELVELGDIFEFRIAVEKKGSVVFCRQQCLVQCLEICRKVVDPLRVEKLKPDGKTKQKK